jgi:predicted nuclease of predicted toxin-antitoxin system
MKFLCDVHISYKIVRYLESLGYQAIHINEILEKSGTKDSDICNYADQNDMIVMTKDADFRDSYFIKQTPKKLIKINLGNISNNELLLIIKNNIKSLEKLNTKLFFLIEIGKNDVNIIHSD